MIRKRIYFDLTTKKFNIIKSALRYGLLSKVYRKFTADLISLLESTDDKQMIIRDVLSGKIGVGYLYKGVPKEDETRRPKKEYRRTLRRRT